MTIADLLVKISGDSSGLRKELSAAQRNIKSAFGSKSVQLSEQVAGKFKWVAAGAAALGIAAVTMSAKMDMTQRSFEVLTGSADMAKQHLSDLQNFAATTPFEFTGLVDASKKLQAYGFEVNAVIPIMQVLGDSAMSVGLGQEGIDRLTLALGQMNAKGKISAEEMRQIAETGLPAWELLAKGIGVSVPEAMDKASKGAIDAKTGITALLEGLNGRFNGMMDKVSGEIPQSFSNMKDSTMAILRTLGTGITETFDLKTRMKNAADWLSQFASTAQNAGIKEAFDQMIPDSVKTSLVAIAATVVGVAVPAFALLAINVIAATWPLLAIGAAFGTAAALIYSNWESVGPFWTGLWNGIVDVTKWAWGILSGIFDAIASAWHTVDVAFTTTINKALSFAGIDFKLGKDIEDVKLNLDTKSADEAKKSVWSLQQALASLKDLTGGYNKEAEKAAKKAQKAAEAAQKKAARTAEAAAKKQQREYEQLQQKAKDTSDRITDEWIQMTGTKMDVLDKWYADEIATLNETKSANTNYQQDITRLEQTYSEKRRRILHDEAKEKQQTIQEITAGYSDIQQNLAGNGLRGSAKDLFDMGATAENDIKSVTDFFGRIGSEYSGATEKHKQDIIEALDAAGVAYKVTAQGNLDFQETLDAYELESKKQLYNSILEYFKQGKNIEAEIEKAHNQMSLDMLKETLSEKNTIMLNNIDAMNSMMETYEEARRASMATTAQLYAGVYKTAFDGISSTISDLVMGVSNLSDAMAAFGKSILQVIVDFYAKKLAGMLMEKVVGQSAIAAQTAASIASAAATSAAWAPAAAAVSLATFGANSAPAMAGITATHALSSTLSAVPGLAEGGYVTGPTLAMVGEGKYNESVIQDSSAAYKKIADGIRDESTPKASGGGTLIIQAMDSKSFETWLEDGGGKKIKKFFVGDNREFGLLGGI